MAAGVDRIVMLLCGAKSVREVALFPMNQQAVDLDDGLAVGTVRCSAARAEHPRQPTTGGKLSVSLQTEIRSNSLRVASMFSCVGTLSSLPRCWIA
jgi:hypothetical protein